MSKDIKNNISFLSDTIRNYLYEKNDYYEWDSYKPFYKEIMFKRKCYHDLNKKINPNYIPDDKAFFYRLDKIKSEEFENREFIYD